MNYSEVLSTVLAIPGAAKARQNKANFIVIPAEDGTVVKVTIGTALAKDTKTCKAFNLEAAVAEYKAWEAEKALKEAEKAAKPAVVKGPNPEAEARRQALDAQIEALPAFTDLTATGIMEALNGQIAENVTVMAIGSSAGRLVEKGVLSVEVRKDEKNPKGKKYYTKA